MNGLTSICCAYQSETGKIKRRNRMSSSMRFPLPKPSFLRNDSMSNTEFKAIPARPCVKCGSTERYKNRNCKACAKLVNAAYVAANPERKKAIDAAWYAANTERVKATCSVWNAANSERVKATSAAWYAANPDSGRIKAQNRKSRKLMNGGRLSRGLPAKLFILQQGKCACCKQPLGDDYHMDHIMPLVLGGANVDANIQLLRAKCNLVKSVKEPIAFMQSRGFLL